MFTREEPRAPASKAAHSYCPSTLLVLAVSKVLITPTLSNLCNFGMERDTTKKFKPYRQISSRSHDFTLCISDVSVSI